MIGNMIMNQNPTDESRVTTRLDFDGAANNNG